MKPKSDNDNFFNLLTNKIVLSKKNHTNSVVEAEKRGKCQQFFFEFGKYSPPLHPPHPPPPLPPHNIPLFPRPPWVIFSLAFSLVDCHVLSLALMYLALGAP